MFSNKARNIRRLLFLAIQCLCWSFTSYITRNISRSENTFIKVFLPHIVAGQRPSGIQNHSHNPLLCYNQSPDSCTEHKADTTCMSYLYCTRSKPLSDKKATLSTYCKYLVNSFNPNPQGIGLLIYQLLFKTILHHDESKFFFSYWSKLYGNSFLIQQELQNN